MTTLMAGIACGLLAWIAQMDRLMVHTFLYRPIILGPIAGLILGNVACGLKLGVEIEIMFLASVFVGTAIPCDEVMSTIIGVAFSVVAGGDTAVGIAAALPLSVLGQIIRYIRASTYHQWTNIQYEKHAVKADLKGMFLWHIWIPLLLNLIAFGVPTFLGVYVSGSVVQAFIDFIPQTLIDGINAGAAMLGAVGLAMLLKAVHAEHAWPYLLVGFFLSAFLGVNMIGISIVTAAICAIIFFVEKDKYLAMKRSADDAGADDAAVPVRPALDEEPSFIDVSVVDDLTL